jgi:hypothetical protein
VNLSSAVQFNDEICFMAVPDEVVKKLDTKCTAVCTRLQVHCCFPHAAAGCLPTAGLCKVISCHDHKRTQNAWESKQASQRALLPQRLWQRL